VTYDTAVILGANGFIARNISAALQGAMKVVGFDLPDADVTKIGTLTNAATMVPRGGKIVVINAAGLMDAQASRKNPDLYYRINGTAIANVVKFCDAVGAAALVQLSSETVYGQGVDELDEAAPRIPLHPYGIAKLVAELMLQENPPSFPAALLRIPVVVGKGQALDNPISLFCKEATKEKSIVLFNGGKHRRKFVAVEDVAAQIAAMLNKGLSPGVEAYNLAGFNAAMVDIAERVAAKVGGVSILDKPSANQAFTLISTSDKIAVFDCPPRRDIDAMINEFLAN